MTIEKFKKDIKKKFDSVRRFCKVANIMDQYPRIKVLTASCYPDSELRRKERQEYYDLAMQTDDRLLHNEIPTEERKWLKDNIYSHYGNTYKFHNKYPQLPRRTVEDIINGRTKTKTQAYNTLLLTVIEDLKK